MGVCTSLHSITECNRQLGACSAPIDPLGECGGRATIGPGHDPLAAVTRPLAMTPFRDAVEKALAWYRANRYM